MANIVDYLEWRGDITFEERPLNDVDNVILSTLSYLDLTGIVPAPGEGSIGLGHACQMVLEETGGDVNKRVRSLARLDPELLTKLAGSRRFGSLRLHDCVDDLDAERAMQFAAVQIDLSEEETYVSFRGTDSTLVGWREDFMLTFTTTGAQQQASRYLVDAAEKAMAKDGRLYVGGHSKGGNLAVFATLSCPLALVPYIACVWNNDGPGLAPEIFRVSPKALLGERYRRIVPEYDMVGIIFERKDDPRVVTASSATGLRQHDPFTWQVTPFGIQEVADLSPETKLLRDAVRKWATSIPMEQRAAAVNQLFDALEAGGARTLDEVSSTKQGLSAVMTAMGELDDSTKDVMRKLVSCVLERTIDAYAEGARGVAESALNAAREALSALTRRKEQPTGDFEGAGETKLLPEAEFEELDPDA